MNTKPHEPIDAEPVADELPHWEEISAKLERDETLTPLELFIYENEPADGAWRDQLAAALANAPVAATFQTRVQPWMMACFGAEISADRMERNHRFLEESLELVQACGCTASEAHQLVDYVFGRAVGEPVQEAGGVMVTLAALCLANGLDMHQAGETELARIWTKVEQIRAKQAAKPKHSPLPAAPPAGDAQDAALASAPVAGEAHPTDDEIIDMAVEPLGIDYDRMPYGVVLFARALLSRYAAPQASADARNAALDEAIEAVTTLYESEDAPYLPDIAKAIESLKSAQQGQENKNAK